MQEFITQYKNEFKLCFQNVGQHESQLQQLNSWWSKVSLIGKINCLKVGSTILDSMDETRQRFEELQQDLVEQLLLEQGRKQLQADQASVQLALDLLTRNLFERTADIGFLAKDAVLIRYLQQQDSSDTAQLQHHLSLYCRFYSVYDDVLLFSPDALLLCRLQSDRPDPGRAEPYVLQALAQPGQFQEYCGPSALFSEKDCALLYLQAVTDNAGTVLGVLCLSFKFSNELQAISQQLLPEQQGQFFRLVGPKAQLLFQSAAQKNPASLLPKRCLQSLQGEAYLVSPAQSQGYQGYLGPGWQLQLWTPLKLLNQTVAAGAGLALDPGALFPQLQQIRQDSLRVSDELDLIVLNGVIAAARKAATEFVPVLDAIRGIGRHMHQVFSSSVSELSQTVLQSQLQELRTMAVQAADMLERNLYERANDCRWWAQNPRFRQALQQPVIRAELQQELTDELRYINQLYSVYAGIYLFDQQQNIVAASVPSLLQRLPASAGADACLQLDSAALYHVSPFQPSELYQDKATYLYQAAILPIKEQKPAGGIALVFDSAPQFSAMLTDVLPKNGQHNSRDGFSACFIDATGKVVSTSAEQLWPLLSQLDLPAGLLTKALQGACTEKIRLQQHDWLVAIAPGRGYREFKTTDCYRQQIYACFFLRC